MMKRMIEYQETGELFCFLANFHALTSVTDASRLKQTTLEAARDFISLGLDPEKAVFWAQSDVPEVAELTWLLSNVTNVGMLERAHSYKDKTAKGATPTLGLFSYPVLVAADILLFGGEIVPVGKDQKQHLEMARDIAIRFNATYGETFVVPEPRIEEDRGVIPGIDGQKMSKSYGNAIEIFCEKDELAKKVMNIVTDPTPVDEPKDPNKSTLYKIYALFLDEPGKVELSQRFKAPGLKYSQVKSDLIDVIWKYFAPSREKREAIGEDQEYIVKTLKEGAKKARAVAVPYLAKAKRNVGMVYWE